MPKSVVSVVKGENPEELVELALGLLGGIRGIIKPRSTVVIKPNAGHMGGPDSSVNTTPAVVAAVIKAVQSGYPNKIILAESSAMGCDTTECLEVSGIKQAAIDAGVDDVRDIKSEKDLVRVAIQKPSSAIKHVDLPRFLIEADHLINVPIFKTHVSMVFSCALKNLKGVVQDHVHYVMHTTNLAGAMMDLGELLQEKTFTIADLYRPMEGFGPHSGTPVRFDCILAGKDLVAVDATACRIVGLPVDKVDFFDAALKKGLGNFNEEDIEVRGNSTQEVFQQLYMPYLDGFGAFPEYRFYVRNACSTCQGLTAFTMSKLKSLGEYEKHAGSHIILGRHKEIPEGIGDGKPIFLMGDCTKGMKKKLQKRGVECFHASGCPPGEPALAWVIMDRKELGEMSQKEFSTIGHLIRERMEREEIAFKNWLGKQQRN
ncbi:MAG: hypothetical protein A2Y65_09445 [Deltaproteobacteria bacterium RBG_13_52_11]|nr:MAG: hypothetical protein A2Y65_09445 [Deltaproteobacteria bacterium RBG_13_52_11]